MKTLKYEKRTKETMRDAGKRKIEQTDSMCGIPEQQDG